MVVHETYRDAEGNWVAPAEVRIEADAGGRRAVALAGDAPLEIGPIEKMSKSKRNTVDPDEIIASYGADTARWFMLSDSPPERDMEWTAQGVEGAWRFVNRLWRSVAQVQDGLVAVGTPQPQEMSEAGAATRRVIHKSIDGVTQDLEQFRFNRAVARVHELSNALAELAGDGPGERWVLREGYETLARLAGPMIPHLAEELWRALGHASLLVDEPWPRAEALLLVDDTVTVAVQVNGKLRGTLALPRDAARPAAEEAALALPAVARALEGRSVRRVILVPNRVINVVI
jgi:leucyl-tRNA synthetase